MKITTFSVLIFSILSVSHAGVPQTNGGTQPALPPLADVVKEEIEVYDGKCSVPDHKTSTYGICICRGNKNACKIRKYIVHLNGNTIWNARCH
ncbi:hypothetical protein BDV35DRAFT_383574 [Aspergillus flavus]|uniref:Uncharacterized protein n=1 Tax=Aspergillus flavus TaxID=5059 RepID=A0A5N6GKP6_ASPFL|nr:hypothetical protein BDV35DRAFT_383574 [Aspergillus flavus]